MIDKLIVVWYDIYMARLRARVHAKTTNTKTDGSLGRWAE